ncbi:Integrase protein [Desulfitobacterium hafniense]|uniref:Integrase protein n=1 Tax=Desulfitobacterium hafniense TaxID=49338 RepID=A0A098AZG8_DESHA|nr:site-specific integrase [Desulfitobacterium hafniense]CDX01512.1 Integrase protein [Desulfitobacterium hafniense]
MAKADKTIKEPKKPEDYKYVKRSFVVGKKEDGSQERIIVRGKTAKEAEAKLAEAKRLHARGLQAGELTVREWSERWQRSYKTTVSDAQKNHYDAKLKLDILPFIGDKRIKDITKADLQALLNGYAGGKKGTVEKIKHTLCLLFGDAVYEGIIERDPSARLDLPLVEVDARRPLTPIERDTLIKVAKGHKHGLYALLILYTGLRRGECLALTVGDIDLDRKRISVTKAIKMKGNTPTLAGTKTAEMKKAKTQRITRGEEVGHRIVPIPDLVMDRLKAKLTDKAPQELVFSKGNGTYVTQIVVQNWWRSIKRNCHIAAGAKLYRNAVQVDTSPIGDEISAHYLRHTYATDLLAAGVDDFIRSAFMGHSSVNVTGGYTKLSEEAIDRALELMNNYYSKMDGTGPENTDKVSTENTTENTEG